MQAKSILSKRESMTLNISEVGGRISFVGLYDWITWGQCHQRPMSGQRSSQTKGLCNKETVRGKPQIMLHYKMYMKKPGNIKKIRKVPRKETFK